MFLVAYDALINLNNFGPT